ncbi:unnamed protein product, partial [marine sediment metagenome]
ESIAYAIPSTTAVGIYVNEKGRFETAKVESSEVGKVIEELIEKLEKVEDNGKKVVSRIIRREEVYKGKAVEKAPDILVEAEDYCIDASLLAPSVIDKRTTSEHAMNGIFLAYGPDIREGELEAEIIDIAPTILHMFEIPVPSDIDGSVLDIFKPESGMSRKVQKKKENR